MMMWYLEVLEKHYPETANYLTLPYLTAPRYNIHLQLDQPSVGSESGKVKSEAEFHALMRRGSCRQIVKITQATDLPRYFIAPTIIFPMHVSGRFQPPAVWFFQPPSTPPRQKLSR